MSELISFIASHREEFAARLGEHVVLVLVSTAIAAAIGIPLGILAARRPSIAKPIVALANLAQTIPSLALFGFLIPLPFLGGIGTRTAHELWLADDSFNLGLHATHFRMLQSVSQPFVREPHFVPKAIFENLHSSSLSAPRPMQPLMS